MAVTILGSGTSPVVGSRTLTNFGTGTEYTFGNGLTNTNNTITLGGTLTTNVAIDANYNFRFGNVTDLSVFSVDVDNTFKAAYNDGAEKSLTLASASMLVTDAVDEAGLQYAADYSTAGKLVTNGLWIPDWASVKAYNTASNGLTMTTGNVVLGGALTGHTVINGGYNLTFGSGIDTFTVSTTGGVDLKYIEDTDETSVHIAGTGIAVTDEVASTGLVYAADYSTAGAIVGDRWIPDKDYVDTYVTTNAAPLSGTMQVAHHQVVFGDSDSDYQIVTLDANDVVWGVKVYVSEIFNDSGYDRLSIGKTTLTEYTGGAADTSVLLSTGWTDYTTGVPDKMTGSQAITIVYEGQNANASTGILDVYIHYTKH